MTAASLTCSSSTPTAATCVASPTTSTPTSSPPGRRTARPSRSPPTGAPEPISGSCGSGTCGSACTTSTTARLKCSRTWSTARTSTRWGTPAGAATLADQPRAAASVYRSPTGFRASSATPPKTDSTTGATAMTVRTLLDSATSLPDTSEFTFKAYHTRFTPDYVARPTVGYERDNFGRGFFGGTAISLSDLLGNHTLVFAGAVNEIGRASCRERV